MIGFFVVDPHAFGAGQIALWCSAALILGDGAAGVGGVRGGEVQIEVADLSRRNVSVPQGIDGGAGVL